MKKCSSTDQKLDLENFPVFDFDKVHIDIQWNHDKEGEHAMNRIHAYPAKFPALITKRALEYVASKNFRVNVVGDIFCGCGTTAYEATKEGKDFWGCDINPVATLIAKVKSSIYKEGMLNHYFSMIEYQFSSIAVKDEVFDTINERIKYWFGEQQIKELETLK